MTDKTLPTIIDDILTEAIQNKTLKDVTSISLNSGTLMDLSLSGSKVFVSSPEGSTYRGFVITTDESLANNKVRLNNDSL